jgi:hypothetical protein
MPGGVEWWNGPDEDLGYVVASPVASNGQPTNVPEDALTLSSTYKGVDIVLTTNQTASQIFGYQQSVLGETIISGTNKVMFSVLCNLSEPQTLIGSHVIGVGTTSMNYSSQYGAYPGNDIYSVGFTDDGNYYYNGSVVSSGLPTWTDGDIIDIVISHGQYWWIRVNGGDWNNNPSANPTTLSNGLTMNGVTNFYPVLCPSYQGTMTVLNYPRYGTPSDYNFLGNLTASVGFYRTNNFDDNEFIRLANNLLNESYTTATDASSGLTSNGYWNSYLTPILSLDAANYSGSGPWIDSVGGKSFTLNNSPTWSSSNGGYFSFISSSAQSAICDTSLPTLSTWTVGVWHYYDGTEIGSAPCIVTETYIGGQLNYSLGNNDGPFSVGFFNGGWQVTDGYSLTANNWYYIVGTYDGGDIKLYINGVLVDTTTHVGNPTSSGAGIRLMERWDLSDYWGGYLATVQIYDKALDSGQITSIWDSTKSRFGLGPTPTPTPTITPTPTPTITPTPTPTATSTPSGFTVTIQEVGSDVVMEASGSLNINDLIFVSSSTSGGAGLGVNTATFIMGTNGTNFSAYSGFTSTPTSFGTGGGLGSSSSSGDIFGVIYQMTPPYQLVVPSGYTTGTIISSTQTFTGQTFSSLGLTQGTYVYSWGSGANADSINVVIGGGGPTPTPTPTTTSSGDGWLFYYSEGPISVGPPTNNGNTVFLSNPGTIGVYNPNYTGGTLELYFNENTSDGTSYLTLFQELNNSGGTMTISQGGSTVIYSGTSSQYNLILPDGFLVLQVSNVSQMIQSASTAFVSGQTINISV